MSWADFRVRGFVAPGGPFFRPGPGTYVNTRAHAKFGDDLPTWARPGTVDVPVSELGGGRRPQAAAARPPPGPRPAAASEGWPPPAQLLSAAQLLYRRFL
jgi:hypothetical protein